MTKLEELMAKRAELDAEIQKAKVEALMPEMIDIPNRNYRVAKTHITQAQYEAVMGAQPKLRQTRGEAGHQRQLA